MKMAKDAGDPSLSLNMTPMIDVVFQLLIFFTMVSALNDMERDAKLKLPEAYATAVQESGEKLRMIVNIRENGDIVTFGLKKTLGQLRTELRHRRGDLIRYQAQTGSAPIIVRGDANCPYKYVKEVLDAIRDEKFEKILFASYSLYDRDRPGAAAAARGE
jgi:biopolymer transport protein ExbD